MGTEIERKFLVTAGWREHAGSGVLIRQGYLSRDPERTVRVRRRGDRGALTVKGKTTGATRAEFEYDIPPGDADALLAMCDAPLVEKWRYEVAAGPHTFEIDEFLGANAGLVVAEIELGAENEAFARPAWLGEEVTEDPRYYNSALIAHPFSTWKGRQ